MGMTSSRVAQSRRWLFLPDGWDTGWKAARAASGTAPAYVTVIGDSNAQGSQSTNWMTKGFPYLLRNALVAKYGLYGDYYMAAQSQKYLTAGGGGTANGTLYWTQDATTGGVGAQFNGLVASMFQENTTYPVAWNNAGSTVFTTPYACTDFDIIYHDWNAAASTWKYNIDNAAGGGLVTVTNDGRNSMRRISVTGQTNAVHTVRFGASSVAYAMGLNGIVTYDPTNAKTRGIGFANCSVSGVKLVDSVGSANQMPPDRMAQWQGQYKSSTSTTLTTGFGFPTQPHLAIVELGINDCQFTAGMVHFRAGLRRLCDALRRGRDNCSIIFTICPNPAPGSSDNTAGFARAESWSLYADQIYAVAAEYQCGVLNLHADWMSTPVAQGFVTATDPHPTDAGHQAIADALLPIII